MNKQITCFSIIEYAKRCDVVFMRDAAAPYIKNSKLSDIKDGCTIYCWSTLLNSLFIHLKSSQAKDLILFSGDNDHSVNPNGCITSFPAENYVVQVTSSVPKNIKKWYAQNAEISNNFMIPLPIGLSPPWVENRIWDINGIENNIVKCNREKLLYTNFNTLTNPKQRTEIQELFNNTNNYNTTNQYYQDLQEHKYVICPPGNGKDTHRVWESLYFGAIPIVEDSSMNRYFAESFPILVVERWSDINNEFLLKKYNSIKSKFKNKHVFDLNEWFNYQKIEKL